MAQRTGSANLPLHYGHVPQWLADRMTRLGVVMTEAIIHHYGRDEVLRRFAHPFWFQSFGAVMGMDWHSSGMTTSVIGALKRGLAPRARELGIHVCGGRGKYSRQTPLELAAIGQRVGLDGEQLAQSSRLVAKVDSAAIQDGYALYLHSFIVTDEGKWAVIQQGMNEVTKQARRYHWLSEDLKSFVEAPHTAIEGQAQGNIINLTDHRAEKSRSGQVELLQSMSPERIVNEIILLKPQLVRATRQQQLALPHLCMPDHHEVRSADISTKRLQATLMAAAERGPKDFSELLLIPGIGARTVQALAMVAEILHGAPYRFSDPARFSLAHGGKDRHPFPVPVRVYDETIGVLKSALLKAKLGREEELNAIRRLDEQVRRLEKHVLSGPSIDEFIQHENAVSRQYGGRSVGSAARPARTDD
ncbi:DUF763 domain-containing protein [Nitrosomonas sp. JL21]|uniref:DUF763 domain-containing protein n=1 Tax=Nitrosomonas sp. JL21 TaxID=153949 RepID=UPI001370017D|nr:DUF763 domain-containing protein [Nitrosomonas sp. JL21]MBL8497735.1 DUF763 domain-containing protein [Nitrosomonas sp.]MXS78321.1 DUF763 domain-containing protein [Nitrosomonas sp. JL21]